MFSKLRNRLKRMLGVQSPSQVSIEACKRIEEIFRVGFEMDMSQMNEGDEALAEEIRRMILEGESLRENDQETG